MQHYSRHIPEFIASDKKLTRTEKLFYGLLDSLAQKYGYCWATNAKLAELEDLSDRHIRRMVRKLAARELIVVEIEHRNHRKIWTAEKWSIRHLINKSIGEGPEIQSKISHDGPVCPSGRTCGPSDYIYIPIHKEKGGIGKHTVPVEAPENCLLSLNKGKNLQTPKLELSESDKDELIDRMGDKNYDKYLLNAQNHLRKSKPGSKYHRMSLKEVIWEFYSKDLKQKLAEAQNKKKKTSTRAERRRQWFAKMQEMNPHTKTAFRADPVCVDLNCQGQESITANFEHENFERLIEDRLREIQQATGQAFVLPIVERGDSP
jgi:phage gp16-like protein